MSHANDDDCRQAFEDWSRFYELEYSVPKLKPTTDVRLFELARNTGLHVRHPEVSLSRVMSVLIGQHLLQINDACRTELDGLPEMLHQFSPLVGTLRPIVVDGHPSSRLKDMTSLADRGMPVMVSDLLLNLHFSYWHARQAEVPFNPPDVVWPCFGSMRENFVPAVSWLPDARKVLVYAIPGIDLAAAIPPSWQCLVRVC